MNDVQKYRLPKELVLDYNLWVCGNFSKKERGLSMLLNANGYMCCLGQFSKQTGCPIYKLLSRVDLSEFPDEDVFIIGLSKKNKHDDLINSNLSTKAIEINDNCKTSIAEKVRLLKRLFSKYHYKIRLKNFPQHILEELKAKRHETNL